MNFTEPIWSKPTRMHWRTFERLKDEEECVVNALCSLVPTGGITIEVRTERSR